MDFAEWFDWLEIKYLSGFEKNDVESIRRFCELAWVAANLQGCREWVESTTRILDKYTKGETQ